MKKSFTILFDANPLMGKRTGVGYYTAQIVEAVAAAHPEATFVGYYYNFLRRKQPPQEPLAPNIHYRAIYHFPGPIINLLRRFHIEVPIELLTFMHADFVFYPNFLNQPSLLKTPNATVVHDLTFVDLPEYVARKNLKDLQQFIPTHIKRTQFVVTASEFARQRIHEEFNTPLDKIVVTPIPASKPQPATTQESRAALSNLHIPGKYFLTLSTIEPRKNVLSMLDAYLLLPQKLQAEYTFVITGMTGWNCEREVARLEELVRRGKNILHLGYVTDEQRSVLYQEAMFYTSASHYEGFGMTLLEAMSYTKPCAVSDIPVFREVAGDAALYFNHQDPASIAAAWERLLMNPELRHRFGNAGKERANTFTWTDVATTLYNKIERTLEGTKR